MQTKYIVFTLRKGYVQFRTDIGSIGSNPTYGRPAIEVCQEICKQLELDESVQKEFIHCY